MGGAALQGIHLPVNVAEQLEIPPVYAAPPSGIVHGALNPARRGSEIPGIVGDTAQCTGDAPTDGGFRIVPSAVPGHHLFGQCRSPSRFPPEHVQKGGIHAELRGFGEGCGVFQIFAVHGEDVPS